MATEEQKPQDSSLLISGLVALVLALGAVLYTLAPFKGERPFTPEIREPSSIQARLWQDPFRAVLDYVNAVGLKSGVLPAGVCPAGFCYLQPNKNEASNQKSQGKSCPPPFPADLIDQISCRLGDKRDNNTVTILSVMVFGGSFAGDIESRRRHRYAVLSGLGRLGFVPEDPEHIQYLKIPQKDFNELPSLENIVPFEWLEKINPGSNKKDNVLVLWINNDSPTFRCQAYCQGQLSLDQLAKLNGLFNYLKGTEENNQLKFKVIGPAGSEKLREMIKELEVLPNPLKGFEIYSVTATAEDSLLLQKGKKETEISLEPSEKIKELFKQKGIVFHRQICADNRLAEALIVELESRGLDLLSVGKHGYAVNATDHFGGYRDYVVLVSEWDTFYGRSLPETFVRELIDKHNCGFHKGDGYYIDKPEQVTWVHPFSYLRGLDGKLPGEQEQEGKERRQNGGDRKQEEDLRRLEEPTGKSQYDYLRRLTERIHRLDNDIKRQGQGSIKAIGILGSDVYDKFLLLQALKPWFPEVVFFTTDLDARFVHSTYNKWTRNLVVASGFGLQLNDKLQGGVPPFRDTYQTALFLATLSALDSKHEILSKEVLNPPLKPRLFEIGRSQAVDLTEGTNGIHPEPYRPSLIDFWRFKNLLYLIMFIMVWLILSQSKTSISGLLQGILRFFTQNLVGVILGGLIIILIILFNQKILQDAAQEPFSWSQGISAWPTEIIRLFDILLACIFFCAASKRLKYNDKEIYQEFCLGTPPAAEVPVQELTGPWWQRWGQTRVFQVKKLGSWLVKLYRPGGDFLKKLVTSPLGVVKEYWKKYLIMTRYYWWPKDKELPASEDEAIGMDELWQEYQARGLVLYRILRVIPFAIVITCAFYLTFFSLYRPIRGYWSRYLDTIILLSLLFAFFSLTFYVFDNTRLCRRFVNLMILKSKAQWSTASLAQFIRKVGRAEEGLKDLMVVRLIAKRTEAVGKQIFYPFIIMVIFLIARSHYFDDWRHPISFLVFIALLALIYTWSCALTLRLQAERTRAYIIDHLSKNLIHAIADDPHQPLVERLQFVLNEIKSTQNGAFAPLTQQPLMHALLVPFGGYGGIQLLNFLSK